MGISMEVGDVKHLSWKVVLACMVASAVQASVVTGPVSFDGHNYYVVSAQTWYDAEAEANALGGHLTAINYQAEQDFIFGLIQDWVTTHWIGFTDEEVEGQWVWINGDPVTYTNWNTPYEPNNYLGIEHCGATEVAWGGKWNDLPCDTIHPAVVEVEGPASPEYSIHRGNDPSALGEIDVGGIPWTDPDPVFEPGFPDILFYRLPEMARIHMVKETDTVSVYTIWPTSDAPANSDPWIGKHHRGIARMDPQVLVLNFSNTASPEVVQQKLDQFNEAIAESSRWHGYQDSSAPAFLQYETAKLVDLRDDPPVPSCDDNSTRYPRKPDWVSGNNFEYSELYGETFAEYYGYVDPGDPERYLTLSELVSSGIVHELWFFANHGSCGAPYETIELKQYYDEALQKTTYGPAGNGHDFGMPWIGHSFRITFINVHRGIGCAMENLGHALEGMMHYNAIPYYSALFREYGGFDLDTRWGLPFASFYFYGSEDHNSYPTSTDLIAHYQGADWPVSDYCAIGGNVHFNPNGRTHYDLTNPDPVMSTIRNWRLGNGTGGEDQAEPFTPDDFAQFQSLAPDCMGPWLVYWRQNMPGLDNRAKQDDGIPMKSWWPFLFY